jgi:enamine deaminase RidA (YjgF/YER057c/UK114 family)
MACSVQRIENARPQTGFHRRAKAAKLGANQEHHAMPKRAIYSDKIFKGSLPFAQATVAGGFMFVCCVGRDRAGNWAVGDVRKQTQQCLDNIRALIEKAGGTMTDIVKCTVYVTDRANWQPMNDVYFANFKDDPPHRVSCIVSGLGAPECLVEIDATAYLGK